MITMGALIIAGYKWTKVENNISFKIKLMITPCFSSDVWPVYANNSSGGVNIYTD